MIAFLKIACLICAGSCDSPQRAKTVSDYLQNGVGYANLATGDALQPEHVDQWAQWLEASDAQREFMRFQYSQWVKHYNELLDHEMPKYLSQSAETARMGQGPERKSAAFIGALQALQHANRRVLTAMERMENDYVDLILPGLTDEQADRAQMLRNAISRRQSRNVPILLRWVNVDLREVWQVMSGEKTLPEDIEKMSPILDDYENRITPLLRRLANARWASSLEIRKLLFEKGEGRLDSAEFEHRYDAIHGKIADAGRRVREITQQTVRLIGDSLTNATAKAFVDHAKAVAFPEAYPDKSAMDQHFAALTASADLDQAAKDSIVAMYPDYVSEYKAAADEIEALMVNWDEQTALGKSGFQRQFLAKALEPLLRKRMELAERWRAKLREAAGESALNAVEHSVMQKGVTSDSP